MVFVGFVFKNSVPLSLVGLQEAFQKHKPALGAAINKKVRLLIGLNSVVVSISCGSFIGPLISVHYQCARRAEMPASSGPGVLTGGLTIHPLWVP